MTIVMVPRDRTVGDAGDMSATTITAMGTSSAGERYFPIRVAIITPPTTRGTSRRIDRIRIMSAT